MGITPQFASGTIANQVKAFQENLDKAILFVLKYLGESLTKYARDNRTYQDQTGNLTNSIGYAVVRNREIVYYSATIQQGIGNEEALKTALTVAKNSGSAYSLIIVAGMNYAAYVEAKGYNVILPAKLKAQKDFPATMNKLVAQAKGKANDLFGNIL